MSEKDVKKIMIEVMHNAAISLRQYPSDEVILFHHNDTDGISSGALLFSTFGNAGYKVSRYALEKPYPQILERVFSRSGRIIVFADFAGKIAPMISLMNDRKNLVVILDHHPGEAVDDPTVINIDAELFGIKGDRDISASAVCYLFSEVLLKDAGKDISGLCHLGVLGAVGDGFLVDGALSGVNRELLNSACGKKLMRIEDFSGGEKYYISLDGTEYEAAYVCEAIDTAGGVGYYSDGSSLGIDICLKGFSSGALKVIDDLIEKKKVLFDRELKGLGSRLRTTEHLQWFDVGDRFRPMGVKMIGVFCTEIRDMDILDRNKYLAGFQTIPNTVPGFGEVDFGSTKISMRVSGLLTEKIRSGELPGLNSFLPPATQNIGGFVDACHGLSAATTVKLGQEELLIDEIEIELKKRIG